MPRRELRRSVPRSMDHLKIATEQSKIPKGKDQPFRRHPTWPRFPPHPMLAPSSNTGTNGPDRRRPTRCELHFAFFVNDVFANDGVVFPQLQTILGVVAVFLYVITMRAFAALHLDVRPRVFAFLSHVRDRLVLDLVAPRECIILHGFGPNGKTNFWLAGSVTRSPLFWSSCLVL